jgi:hypothetical protein
MTDRNEIETLKASLRGALAAAEPLAALSGKVQALDPHGDVAAADLEELARLALAHAIAAQALRGFIETMRTRRGATV